MPLSLPPLTPAVCAPGDSPSSLQATAQNPRRALSMASTKQALSTGFSKAVLLSFVFQKRPVWPLQSILCPESLGCAEWRLPGGHGEDGDS